MTTAWLVGLGIRATMILVGAMMLAVALRRSSSALRHTLWTVTTVVLLALPLVQGRARVIPGAWWQRAETMLSNDAPPSVSDDAPLNAIGGNNGVSTTADLLVPINEVIESSRGSIPLSTRIFWAWMIGLVACAVPVLVGVFRAHRLMRRAVPTTDARLLAHLARARDAIGVSRSVTLAMSPEIRTAMTGGVLHSVVLLPTAATEWSDDCVATVLRHELVHVHRADALRQVASRVAVALYWYNPLAWRAARHGALAREQACDEAVLHLGVRPSSYARHLLDLADPDSTPDLVPALARIDHPHLEDRVMAILHASPAQTSRPLTFAATGVMLVWGLGVAVASPAPERATHDEIAVGSLPPALLQEMRAPAPDRAEPALALVADALPAIAQDNAADCEPDRNGAMRTSSDSRGSARMYTTTVDGVRLCVTVRGNVRDGEGFVPRGRLAQGVIVTMQSSGSEGEQRLVITGGASGNSYQWMVDGRERPFDASAERWRDAMYDTLEQLLEESERHRVELQAAREVARAHASEAREMAREAAAAGRRAAIEARAADREVRTAETTRLNALARTEARRAREVDALRERNDRIRSFGGGMRAPSPPEAPPVPTARREPSPPPALREARVRELQESQMRLQEQQRRMQDRAVEMQQRLREREVETRNLVERRVREMDSHTRTMEERRRVERPVMSEGRGRSGGGVAVPSRVVDAPPVPVAPPAISRGGGVSVAPATPVAPRMINRTQDPEVSAAVGRLREAMRATRN